VSETREELAEQVCDWGNTMGTFVYQKTSTGIWCTYCPVCKVQLGHGGLPGLMGDIRYNHLMEHSDDELKRHIVACLMKAK
jgi:hypothetical protein